jgi:CHASE2 domain-containing sensor protein
LCVSQLVPMSTQLSSKHPKRLIPLWKGLPLLIAAGLLLTFGTILLYLFPPLFLQQTELLMYDNLLASRMSPPKTAVPVLVGIDDASLKAYGQWPWPRYRIATLVQRLNELGADVIALDFIMPEPDRTSPDVIKLEQQKDMGIMVADSLLARQDINSRKLAMELANRKTILGYYFDFSNSLSGAPTLPEGLIVSSSASNHNLWPKPAGVLRSIPTLTSAATCEGFTNAQHDIDGVLRRVPLMAYYQGRYFPSLAFSAMLLTTSDRKIRLTNDGSESLLTWGRRQIPLDRSGNIMIDFRSGSNAFRYISAKDILSGTPVAGDLHGKIMFVGAWAQGLGDMHQIPGGQSLSGLGAHATIVDNILSGTFVSRPGWSRGAELIAVFVLGITSTALFCRAGFVISLATVFSAITAIYIGSRHLLIAEGIYLSPLMPILVLLLVMSALSLIKYGIEARNVLQRNRDLIEAQDAIIISMSSLAEARDEETGGHIMRTKYYVEILARQLATMPNYTNLDENSIDLLAKSAPLHDIGKVGIPDYILHKPTPLTEEEYEIMKTHTLIGADALNRAISGTAHPENLDFLRFAQQMIESHHEKWDGSGYPHGLKGTDIPLAGRLMALADVYDALVSRRVYKRDYSHEEAKVVILGENGQYFDPDVVAAFEAKNEEFIHIAKKFTD